MVGQWKALT